MPNQSSAVETVFVRPISVAEARSVRRSVLRPHQSEEESSYQLDNEELTLHVGCFVSDKLIGVGSVFCEASDASLPESGKSWRIRGMATSPDYRSRGFGTAILDSMIDHARSKEGAEVWCNARMSAADFYAARGFEIRGAEFDLPGIGLHVRMFLDL